MRYVLVGASIVLLFLAAATPSQPPLRDDEFPPGCEASVAVKVNERGTCLRTPRDAAKPPTIIRPADADVALGDSVLLERFGSFQYQGRTDPARVRFQRAEVFSASDVLLAPSEPRRVPGARATRPPRPFRRPLSAAPR